VPNEPILSQTDQTATASTDRSVEDLILRHAVSIADTAAESAQIWIDEAEGQILRVDPPTMPEPPSRPVEAIVQAAALAEAERLAELERRAEAASRAEAEHREEVQRREENQRAAERERAAEAERESEAERVAEAERISKPVRPSTIRPTRTWNGAAWEVDAFDIPHSVADLFFDEAFFRSIAEHMGESVRDGLRSVLVTSVGSGEGRSTVAIGTAIAAAATGLRVALVDADLDTPSQTEHLRLEIESDWVTAIRQGQPLESVAITSLEDGVTLLPLSLASTQGRPVTPTEMEQMMDQIEGCFDLVMYDGPSANCWATSNIAAVVDSGLIVRDTRTRSKADIAFAAERLRRQGVRGLGVVDNFCG
jgi:Mrp family chromosome partitioning ATPase